MVGVVVWTTLLLLVVAAPGHTYTLEECAQYDLPGACYSTLENKIYQAFVQSEVCQAVNNYIDCLETVGCECNLTLSYNLASSLTYIQHYYETQDCPAITGPLDDTKGIPCEKWGNSTGTTDGQLLVLSISATSYVITLEDKCPGFKSCYGAYDAEGALAVHNRNLTQLCTALDRLVTCLENAACGCNGGNETDIIYGVLSEDGYYRQTCEIVRGSDMIPRSDIMCKDDGTAVVRTVCDVPDPTYKCYMEYEYQLIQYGNTPDVQCPATKTYIECVEGIACQCGLIRDWSVYQALTSAIAHYNRTDCLTESGPIKVIPGLQCPDGTGTRVGEDRIILAFADHPTVEIQERWCRGITKCYRDIDNRNGVALFEKNNQKLCANMKLFVECMEMAYCQCGVYSYENTTNALATFRDSHEATCFTDSVLREDFVCKYGTIGFKCFDDGDCQVVDDSICATTGMCDCKKGFVFTANNASCTHAQVSGGTSYSIHPLLHACAFVLFLLMSIQFKSFF